MASGDSVHICLCSGDRPGIREHKTADANVVANLELECEKSVLFDLLIFNIFLYLWRLSFLCCHGKVAFDGCGRGEIYGSLAVYLFVGFFEMVLKMWRSFGSLHRISN